MPALRHDDDAALVRLAQAGDRGAFDALARRHGPAVIARAFLRIGHRADAEDVAQEALAKAWAHLPALEEPQRFAAWISAITANACRTWFRRARTRRSEVPQDPRPGATRVGVVPVPWEVVASRERARLLHDALLALPEANRLALLMHAWGDASYADIAAAAGVAVTTVEGRIYRAKAQLRDLLRGRAPADFPSEAGPAGRQTNARRSQK